MEIKGSAVSDNTKFVAADPRAAALVLAADVGEPTFCRAIEAEPTGLVGLRAGDRPRTMKERRGHKNSFYKSS